MRNLTYNFDNQSATDSKIVAQIFGVSHNNMIKKIRNILLQFPEIEDKNFFLYFDKFEQADSTCNYLPYYIMTYDGFYYLCVNYSCEKIRRVFINFIKAFEKTDKDICNKFIPTMSQAMSQGKIDSKSLAALARHIRASELKTHGMELVLKNQKSLAEFAKRVDEDGTAVLTKLLNSENIDDAEIEEFVELSSKKVGCRLDKKKIKQKVIELRKQKNKTMS